MPELLVRKEAVKLLQDMADMDFRETLKFAPIYRTERYTYYSADDLRAYANGDDERGGIGERYFLLPIHVFKEELRMRSEDDIRKLLNFIDVPTFCRANKKYVRVRYSDIIPDAVNKSKA